MWMVRAGQKAVYVQDFEEKNSVFLGFGDVGDMSGFHEPSEVTQAFKELNPDMKPGKIRSGAGQLSRFRFELNVGDQVVTYAPEFREYLIGEITSEYGYDDSLPHGCHHYRSVKWIGKVERDKLSIATRNTIGAIMTLFLINEEAANEITSLLSGKPSAIDSSEIEDSDNGSDLDDQKKEIQEKAKEYIKDLIQKLDWDEMQELIAGILRAMGYRTRVASPGPDRGTDIIASPDGLGLEQPRIRAEVKHRAGSVGAPMLRSFTGGLRQNDRGLYVSTGGFTKEARYESERSTVPVTLVDIDELAEILVQYYDDADSETKALVPLVKLYWPA